MKIPDHILAFRPKASKPCLDWLASLPDATEPSGWWPLCQRGDWMLWYLARFCGPVNTDGHRKFAAAKCRCARLVLHLFEEKYPADARPRKAIELAEEYANGTDYRADDAADAAAAAYDAAWDADADASYAAAAAADAAYTAYGASYTDYAAAASRSKMLAECAAEIRAVWPTI